MAVKPGEVGMVYGIPDEHIRRSVVIYSPARTAIQQGSGKVGKWKINFMSTQKCENPLMRWTSTGDPYANVGDAALGFDSEEAAKSFAEKHGWEYVMAYSLDDFVTKMFFSLNHPIQSLSFLRCKSVVHLELTYRLKSARHQCLRFGSLSFALLRYSYYLT